MVNKTDEQENGGKPATKAEKLAARQKKQAEKQATRGASGRPTHLCSLATVEVRRGEEGYQVFVNGADGRRNFVIGRSDVAAVLRDLETAIHVIRASE